MQGRVTFRVPIILVGLLDGKFTENNDEELMKYFKQKGDQVASITEGNDHPKDLRDNPIRFSEKYYSGRDVSFPNSRVVAYRVNYKGYDILIGDESGSQKEEMLIPDDLFEM